MSLKFDPEEYKGVAIEYASAAFIEIKDALAGKWDAMTDLQKHTLERATKRVLELEVQKLAGKDVAGDLAFVRNTIAGFKLAGEIEASSVLQDAFWKGVDKAAGVLGTFLITALKGLI